MVCMCLGEQSQYQKAPEDHTAHPHDSNLNQDENSWCICIFTVSSFRAILLCILPIHLYLSHPASILSFLLPILKNVHS